MNYRRKKRLRRIEISPRTVFDDEEIESLFTATDLNDRSMKSVDCTKSTLFSMTRNYI